tara:strand:- start:542 stop:745 length:204 start_codon:yes stop_codon:yes gene_type:complete
MDIVVSNSQVSKFRALIPRIGRKAETRRDRGHVADVMCITCKNNRLRRLRRADDSTVPPGNSGPEQG